MAAEPKLVIQKVMGVTIVRFEDGRILESVTIEKIAAELYRLVDELDRRKLILDFTMVHFLASAAVGVLITLRKKVADVGGKLVICGLRKQLREVFRIMKIEKLFTFVDDEGAAMNAFEFTAAD